MFIGAGVFSAPNVFADEQTATQLYNQGCSLHEAGNYAEAENYFNQVVNDYPEAQAAPKALLRLAYFDNRNLSNQQGVHSVKYDSLTVSPHFVPEMGVLYSMISF